MKKNKNETEIEKITISRIKISQGDKKARSYI
jgi:hypothetical protein